MTTRHGPGAASVTTANTEQIRLAVNRAATQLAHLAHHLPAILARLDEMQPGCPSRTAGASNTAHGFNLDDDPQRRTKPRTDTPNTDPDTAPIKLTPVEALAESLHRDAPYLDLANVTRLADTITNHVDTITKIATPYRPLATTKPPTADLDCPADWCRSCYRDNQHHSPLGYRGGRKANELAYPDRDTNGDPIPGRGLCNWCGKFHEAHDQLPPLPVLRLYHQGRRVTTKELDKHLTTRSSKR